MEVYDNPEIRPNKKVCKDLHKLHFGKISLPHNLVDYNIEPSPEVVYVARDHFHYRLHFSCFLEIYNEMLPGVSGGLPYVRITKINATVRFPLATLRKITAIED